MALAWHFGTGFLALWHLVRGMSDEGDFKGNRPELGHRLPRQRGLGPGNFARRFAPGDDEPLKAFVGRAEKAQAAVAAFGAGPKKRGPAPSSGRPWEAEGISRRTYFRRKKGGGK
jgi:hypothetical protein